MKLHSQVGLITNSSSTTYTSATHDSIGALKGFANELLKLAGSNFSVDDLIEIKIRVTDESIDNILWRLSDLKLPGNLQLIEFLTPEELTTLQDFIKSGNDFEAKKKLQQPVKAMVRRVIEEHDDEGLKALGAMDEWGDTDRITYETVITTKDGKEIVEHITNSVEAWEVHD